MEKSSETTREALLFFFSDDGEYIRDLLEDTVVDGVDSLSKNAVAYLMNQLGLFNAPVLIPGVSKRVNELTMINMSEEDRKRVNTIMKMWNYFGPSPENLGANNNDYLNPSNIIALGTEVGPYVPVVYP